MGKTFSTGLLTDGISQDSSNNIGIGGATSGTNKFEVSGSTKLNGNTAITGSLSITGSATTIGNTTITGSLTVSSSANAIILPAGQTIGLGTAQIYTGTGGNSGNIFVQGAQTKLYADKVILEAATAAGVEVIGGTKLSGSFIVSGSATTIGNTVLSGSLNVSGSITSTSTITAQTLVVQTITSSVLYSSGSNVFGNSLSNTQLMTGSVGITGSLSVNGNVGVGGTASGTYGKLSVYGGINTIDDNNSKLEIGRYSSGASNSYIKLGANSNSLRFTNAEDLADIMVLTNSGSLGLGVTAPRSILEVQKTTGNTSLGVASNASLLLSQGGSTNELSQILFGYTYTTSPAVISYKTTDAAAYTKGALIFATRDVTTDTAPTERMSISSTGAVELTSTSPKITFTPSGYAGSYRTVLGARGGAEGVLQLGNNNPNYIVGGNTGAGGALHFYVNATSDFITSTNGTLSLVLASTGAATFYSSVTATSFNTSANSSISENSGTVPASTATTIFTKVSGNGGGFVLVTGRTAAGNWFFDTVAFNNDNSANAISSNNGGSPPSRTYSVSGDNLQLTVVTALSSFYCFGLTVKYT